MPAVHAALILSALLLGGCRARISNDECTLLIERYVELLVKSQTPEAPAEEILKAQVLTRDRIEHDAEFARCPNEVSRSEYQCAMQAANADKFEQCLL